MPKDKSKISETAVSPSWALRSCKAFVDQSNAVNEVLQMCSMGAIVLKDFDIPQILALWGLGEGTASQDLARAQDVAAAIKARANNEVDATFSTLYAQATVSLWSGLEYMVKDLVRDWILCRPEILSQNSWANLKVRLGDYEPLDDEQRAGHLVDLMDLNVSAALKQGVTRFERLLETVGLGGEVPDGLGKTLFELQQVRNILVHRQGVADKRFCCACPWMNATPSQRLSISTEQYGPYFRAAMKFTTGITLRIAKTFENSARSLPA
jgi:hypothetical protein